MSAIVFVKERNATATLAKVIMDAAEHMPELRGVKVGFVVGGQTSFAFKACNHMGSVKIELVQRFGVLSGNG